MSDTTRRYPRTAIEAFKGPDYANSVTHYETQTSGDRAVFWACLVSIVSLVVILIWEAL